MSSCRSYHVRLATCCSGFVLLLTSYPTCFSLLLLPISYPFSLCPRFTLLAHVIVAVARLMSNLFLLASPLFLSLVPQEGVAHHGSILAGWLPKRPGGSPVAGGAVVILCWEGGPKTPGVAPEEARRLPCGGGGRRDPLLGGGPENPWVAPDSPSAPFGKGPS